VLVVCFGVLVTGAYAQTPLFTPGNLVVSIEGNGVVGQSGSYGDNQAAPLTLFQYQPNGTSSASFVNSLVLPQSASGANAPVSGEYGSSSEGTIQLAGTGQYFAIMGYGVNASAFNANPATYGSPGGELGQSGSLTGQTYTPVPRVTALIDAYGNVNSSTAIFNIFNGNNPRSTFTADGTHIYVSGQGTSGDATGGTFYTTLGSSSATSITGTDAGSGASQDTRVVQIYNNTLYVSMDSKSGAYNRSYIGTLGTPPATSVYSCGSSCPTGDGTIGPALMKGFGNTGGTGREQLTVAQTNGINVSGDYINLSPENYFFASPTVLYVADSGSPKNTSAQNQTPYTLCGAGGLQKWVNVSGTWTWEYTLYQGLNLVQNASCSSNTSGTTGLIGLTGVVSGGNVYLYATNYTIADLDPTYLYGITDVLSATTNPGGESFTQLAVAPPDSNFKGVSFVPTLPAGSATITSSPSGLAFTSAGTGCAAGTYTTPVTLIWTPGSSCALSVVSPQTASGAQYSFAQWQDGTTSTTDRVTASSSPTVYTASFTTTTSIAVTSVSPASEDYGSTAPVTITAVLSWAGNGPAPTASSVNIGGNGPSSYGATTCGAPSGTTITCTATYTPTAADTPGSYTETATFAGDSNYTGASSTQTNNFTVNQASAGVSVASSANPATYGQAVTFTATISGENGQVKGHKGSAGMKPQTVTGSVTWSDNTGCGATTVSAGNPGIASCTTSSLSAGTDVITATYSGDSNHSGSTGTLAGGESISQAATSISVNSVSPASEDFGSTAPVTITAVVTWAGSGAAPTATDVTFGGNGLSGSFGTTSCGAASGDTITCTNTYTPSGADSPSSYTITATFLGDSNYSGSSSSQTNNFTINQASATTTVTSGNNPSTYGQSVTFTATITGENNEVKGRKPARKRGAKPLDVTGTVTWSSNTGCGTTNVTSGNPGSASCTTSSLAGGSDTVTATYGGDGNHSGGSGSVSQQVNPASQTIAFTTAAPSSAVYNTTFPVAASASSSLTAAFTAAGSCSVVDNGNGTATYTVTSGAGTCKVIANQAGNSNYSVAAQVTETVSVTPASQTIDVTVPAPASAVNKSSFTIVANASSGLPITYTSSGACTNVHGTYTMDSSRIGAVCTVSLYAPTSANYLSATLNEATSVAAPIAPTVSLTAPADAQYGSTFSVTATTNASTTAVITATGSCTVSGTTVTMTSGTGMCSLKASWAADDVYKAATATAKTTAEKVVSVITWATPVPITYGTALSSTQLDATASVPGAFVYSPAAGAVPRVPRSPATCDTLKVTFTPTQTTDYTKETATVCIVVNPATAN
jgi:hypothetical protein